MPARKTLYLLRRPILNETEALLPATSPACASDAFSLVLLEEAATWSPSFPGQVYVLQPPSGSQIESVSGKTISYRDLVGLIVEHDATIVL